MPSINIAYRKAVDMKATKLARGYSHVYQDGAEGQVSELRNSTAAIRNSICEDVELNTSVTTTAQYRQS
jgi:hypothetical protein